MPPTHTVTSRPPTEAERRTIEHSTKPNVASYGCLALIFGVVPVWLLSSLGGWVARHLFPSRVVGGRLIGSLAGVAIFAAMFIRFLFFESRHRRRAKGDAAMQMVQDFTVNNPRVIEIGLINNNAPILAFDIGEGKILFLQGQWLDDDPSLYDAPPRRDDDEQEDSEFLNGLPAPYSFPSTAFTLSRLPHSGKVLNIRVSGEYLSPEKTVEALRREHEFGQSELFDGDLDHIADVLAREHAERIAK